MHIKYAIAALLGAAFGGALCAPAAAQERHFWERVYAPGRTQEVWALREAQTRRESGVTLVPIVERLEELAPEGDGALFFGALLARQEGRLDEASRRLERLIARGDALRDLPARQVWAELAHLRTLQGRHPEALQAWEESLGAARSGPHADAAQLALTYHHLGDLYAALGQPDAAAVAFRDALRRDPRLSLAMLGLAALAERRGERDDAHAWALEATLTDPGLTRALRSPLPLALPGEPELRRGLALEAVGRPAEAAALYQRGAEAAGPEGALHDTLRASLRRAEAAPAALLLDAPAPLRAATAVAFSRDGRVAWGDAFGRVIVTRGLDHPEAWLLSGPAILGLAFDPAGRLIAARADGVVTTWASPGRAAAQVGPLVSPSGTQIDALSLDGRAVLLGRARGRAWGIVALERPEVEVGQVKLRLPPQRFALGPLDLARQRATGAFVYGNNVQLAEVQADAAAEERGAPVDPSGGVGWSADGRLLAVASWHDVTLYRAAEARPVARLELPEAGGLSVSHVVVDAEGALGWGPALLLVGEARVRVARWPAPP